MGSILSRNEPSDKPGTIHQREIHGMIIMVGKAVFLVVSDVVLRLPEHVADPHDCRLFVKVGRRKFCSERCQTKEHLKIYYSPEAIAEREAAEEGRDDVHTKTR